MVCNFVGCDGVYLQCGCKHLNDIFKGVVSKIVREYRPFVKRIELESGNDGSKDRTGMRTSGRVGSS